MRFKDNAMGGGQTIRVDEFDEVLECKPKLRKHHHGIMRKKQKPIVLSIMQSWWYVYLFCFLNI